MQTITFECEVITPMFLAGADGQTPELRAPSIKGALRFWWRAMNGHLPLEDRKDSNGKILEKGMRTIEGEIFGSTTQRSKVIIQGVLPNAQINITEEAKVPHKPFKNRAISKNNTFTLRCCLVPNKTFSEDQLRSLVFLTFTLGGIGGRVRRGFGSVKSKDFDEVNMENILKHLENINPKFRLITEGGGNKIISDFQGSNAYPFIQSIEIGRPQSNLIQKIADTTHILKKREGRIYEASLGFASRERFASPIYVSSILAKNGISPIITSLNTVPQSNYKRDIDKQLQKEFKNSIL